MRGKNLGIVGYGHIGTQVGLLAEAIGMRGYFHDERSRLALVNVTAVRSPGTLLTQCDVISLHVPESPDTVNLIGVAELACVRAGVALINASRDSVVDIDALSEGGINIEGQYLQTDAEVGYVVVDFDMEEGFDVERLQRLKAIAGTLRVRIVTR